MQVTFFGHLIYETGISIDPQKIQSVQAWPILSSVTEVRSFVGPCSYLRKFIPNFSTICKPLHVLTEKGHKFEWTDKCETAFNTLTSVPILAFPAETSEFVLKVQEGQERVIAYYSKCFSRTVRKYCTIRKEFLAVVCSIKHFHHYLYDRHFTVRSDHCS